jgi:hypothetical protein
MLDILRRHASSWLIKFILGAIIISFAFFFGYNRMTRARRAVKGTVPGGGEVVAMVNGVEISDSEFRFFFDRNFERLKNSFKGDSMPESIRKLAESMTLQQLIQRELMLQTASNLGITISDEQLASTIRKNPELIKDGEFDPIFYRHQFLPYFENHFGINYEEFVRQDLAIQALETIFAGMETGTPTEKEKTVWTFDVVSLNPKKLIEDKVVGSEEEAKKLADSFISRPKEWKQLAKRSHAEIKTVGPITIAERGKLLSGSGTFEDFEKIFALNESHPSTLIEHGDNTFPIMFVQKKSSPETAAQARTQDFLGTWLQHKMTTAKIQTYLKGE